LRIENEPGRQLALAVMRAIYRDEKNWVQDDEKLVAREEITDPNISWFVVISDGQPAGVLRVLYEPPADLYHSYGMKFLDQGQDIEALLRHRRIAEVGRFAVLPDVSPRNKYGDDDRGERHYPCNIDLPSFG